MLDPYGPRTKAGPFFVAVEAHPAGPRLKPPALLPREAGREPGAKPSRLSGLEEGSADKTLFSLVSATKVTDGEGKGGPAAEFCCERVPPDALALLRMSIVALVGCPSCCCLSLLFSRRSSLHAAMSCIFSRMTDVWLCLVLASSFFVWRFMWSTYVLRLSRWRMSSAISSALSSSAFSGLPASRARKPLYILRTAALHCDSGSSSTIDDSRDSHSFTSRSRSIKRALSDFVFLSTSESFSFSLTISLAAACSFSSACTCNSSRAMMRSSVSCESSSAGASCASSCPIRNSRMVRHVSSRFIDSFSLKSFQSRSASSTSRAAKSFRKPSTTFSKSFSFTSSFSIFAAISTFAASSSTT
mmetsp:Transcript_3363/g.12066  ORF Transcript_3363/g.12066 Transcript_3363/m.12066 type:complete len:358 (-) Transcript_3363:887-1960(-)